MKFSYEIYFDVTLAGYTVSSRVGQKLVRPYLGILVRLSDPYQISLVRVLVRVVRVRYGWYGSGTGGTGIEINETGYYFESILSLFCTI